MENVKETAGLSAETKVIWYYDGIMKKMDCAAKPNGDGTLKVSIWPSGSDRAMGFITKGRVPQGSTAFSVWAGMAYIDRDTAMAAISNI